MREIVALGFTLAVTSLVVEYALRRVVIVAFVDFEYVPLNIGAAVGVARIVKVVDVGSTLVRFWCTACLRYSVTVVVSVLCEIRVVVDVDDGAGVSVSSASCATATAEERAKTARNCVSRILL